MWGRAPQLRWGFRQLGGVGHKGKRHFEAIQALAPYSALLCLCLSLRSTSKSELPLLAQGHAHEWLHKSIK